MYGSSRREDASQSAAGKARESELPFDAAALFFDLDGTLAPIAETPDGAELPAAAAALLRSAEAALDGRLAIVSGRSVSAVDRITGGLVRCVAGVYGLQHRGPDGVVREVAAHPGLPHAIQAVETFARANPAIVVELKGPGVSVHYRRAPALRGKVMDLAERLAGTTGLVLQDCAMAAELMSPGADKGSALRRFMAEPPFAGVAPIFVGDDVSDEAGFVAAAALDGWGVIVGRRTPTHARFRLSGPERVLDWLAASLARRRFATEDLEWAG